MDSHWNQYKWIWASLLLFALGVTIENSTVGLLITLLFATFAMWKPKDALFILLIYFPTRSFLIEMNPGLKSVGDLIIIAVLLRIVYDQRNNWRTLFHLHSFEWAFLLFLVVGSMSALFTGVGIIPIVFQLRAFVITFLLLYIVRRMNITKSDLLKFLWVTFAMAIVLSIHGLVEKLSLRTWLMPERWVYRSLSHNNRVRIYGLINNPNVLAVYLSIAFILSLYLRQLVTKNMKWIITVGMVLMMGVWTLTYSRGTWIAFLVGSVTYFILVRKWKPLVQIAVIIVAATFIINLPVASLADYIDKQTNFGDTQFIPGGEFDDKKSDARRRLEETFNEETVELSSQTGRLFIVKKGFEIFKDHPIIGTGFATYGDSAAKSFSSPIYDPYGIEVDIYADNQYIQVITETGIIGVLLFAIFLIGMLLYLRKQRKQTTFAPVLLAILLSIYWCGMIYNIWEDKTFTMYFFLMLGALIGRLENKGDGKCESTTSN